MSRDLLVIAAGGTAGHMFPAQSLAEAWLAQGGRVTLSTDARGARYTSGFPKAVKIDVLSSATFARGGLLAKLLVPFKILAGTLGARSRFRADRPAIVVGFGGYPSIPAMAAARLMGLPRILHEQNGVLGRTNQLFVRHVSMVACGTWPTALPDGVPHEFTGNPVRQSIRDVAGAAYPSMEGSLRVVVFGGSQGSTIVSDSAAEALGALPTDLREKLRVTHQARDADQEKARAIYEKAGVSAEVTDFISDMDQQLKEAHLVVCRSGASSVADVSAVGRPAIFIPLAIAIRDEQTANAEAMHQAGAALVIQERDLTPEGLASEVAKILQDPAKAAQMAAAAKSCGRPDATQALLDIAQKLAEKD
ncbi:MAG: undecaprenyldiphospho-muramoylpentapeptide beta-N-acetylglucosaminyltransferase [Pseudomonadota bacterium]